MKIKGKRKVKRIPSEAQSPTVRNYSVLPLHPLVRLPLFTEVWLCLQSQQVDDFEESHASPDHNADVHCEPSDAASPVKVYLFAQLYTATDLSFIVLFSLEHDFLTGSRS